MHFLTITQDPSDTPDPSHTFIVSADGRYVRAMLRKDWMRRGDGVLWAKALPHTIRCPLERDRLRLTPPIKHGDTVTIEGREYQAVTRYTPSLVAIFNPL